MIRPFLASWIEDRNQAFSLRVAGANAMSFIAIAAASKRQIIGGGFATAFYRDNVINVECLRRARSRAETILAAPSGARFDQSLLFG